MSTEAKHDSEGLRLLESNNLEAIGAWLDENPNAMAAVSAATPAALLSVVSRVPSPEMAGLLVDHGLGLAAVSRACASGFGLDRLRPPVAAALVERGAVLSPHAAARLGQLEVLRDLLDEDPSLVHAPGGDGAMPLHFSRNLEIARLLLDHGAEVDARDTDHDSTAAQWRIGDAPEITRELLDRGARPDLFMAAGLGDLELARRMVAENPDCTTWRIGNNSGPFPGVGFGGKGGTIYQWTLGFNRSAVEVALDRGHDAVAEFLLQHTPIRAKFLIACARADRPQAEKLLKDHPGLIGTLSTEELGLLAICCWETNFNPAAVALMLEFGFPVATPEFNHGYQPLHNAAWQGHPGVVELLIQHGHPLNDPDPRYNATPADWALHSCLTEKRHPEGDFAGVMAVLLAAGARPAHHKYPSGNSAIDQVWAAYVRE